MHTKTHNSLREFTKTEGVLGYPSGVPNLFAYLGKMVPKREYPTKVSCFCCKIDPDVGYSIDLS